MATVEVVSTPPQILQGSAVTLSAQFYSDGTAADPGVTTLGITDSAGNVEVAAGTATGGTGTAARTYALAAATADLDTLTVTWTTANLGTLVTEHEVVGAFLFTLTEARTFDRAVLADTVKYLAADIEAARQRIGDQFERICGVSFIERYRLETFNGTGQAALLLSRGAVTAIRSVETRTSGGVVWTAYTASELADLFFEPWGELRRETLGTFTDGRRNVRVGYEHGYETPSPDIKRAALMTLRYELVESNYSDRTISTSNELGGTVQYWTPGLSGRGTAIHPLPEVDRILKLYMQTVPVIA